MRCSVLPKDTLTAGSKIVGNVLYLRGPMRCVDIQTSDSALINMHCLCVCGTYWYRSAPLRGGDHVSSKGLWRVDTLADFLLDEIHGEGKLLPGQLTYLPCVCQSPAGKSRQTENSSIPGRLHHTVEQNRIKNKLLIQTVASQESFDISTLFARNEYTSRWLQLKLTKSPRVNCLLLLFE